MTVAIGPVAVSHAAPPAVRPEAVRRAARPRQERNVVELVRLPAWRSPTRAERLLRPGMIRSPRLPRAYRERGLTWEHMQGATLGRLFELGEAVKARGGRPKVLLDVDNAAVEQYERTLAAGRVTAERWGIPELARPETLRILGANPPVWFKHFWRQSGLATKYRGKFTRAQLEAIFTTYDEAFFDYYYTGDFTLQMTDTFMPGLNQFATDLGAAGIDLVIWTGRREMSREATAHTFERQGILVEGGETEAPAGTYRAPLVMPPDHRTDTDAVEKQKLAKQVGGDVIGIIDDQMKNLARSSHLFPRAMLVHMVQPGYVGEKAVPGDYNLDRQRRRRDRGVLVTFERPGPSYFGARLSAGGAR